MLYKLKGSDNLNTVAAAFGYTDSKKFFKTMRYVSEPRAWIPGAIIECPSEPSSPRDRAYDGQSHTDAGLRGKTFVEGLTMRDIVDCYKRAVALSAGHVAPDAYEEANKGGLDFDLYAIDLNQLDPGAIGQNLTCEIERMMGIFPNVPELANE